jgi:hypothetical protein
MALKRNLYFALTGVLLIALAVIYYLFNPAKYSFFPKCPFHALTKLDCPGCGSQRAIYSLLHGNLKQALGYNLLLIISLPFLLVQLSYKIRSFMLKRNIRWGLLYHPLTPKIIFVIVMIFWIARNIPATPFSYLSADH